MECRNCGICCSYVTVEIPTPKNLEDLDILRWYLSHENVWIFIDDSGWNLQFNTPCKYRKDGKCSNYEKRPNLCRQYTADDCEGSGKEEQPIVLIKDLNDFEENLSKNSCLDFKV